MFKTNITFAQQSRQQVLEQKPQKLLRNKDISKAQKLIALGRSTQFIQDHTNLTEREVLILIELEKA